MTFRFGNPARFLGAATLAAVGAWFAATSARADFIDNIYTSGHSDGFAVSLVDDDGAGGNDPRMSLHYGFEGAIVNGSPLEADLDPGDVTTIVSDANLLAAPGDLPFLGVSAGEDTWILPQINEPGRPFLGFSTETLEPSEWSTPITFSLTGFSGPGNFALFQNTVFGAANVLFETNDGIGADDAFDFPIFGHDHSNWGFTAPGIYDLTVSAVGTHNTFGLLSDSATYRFQVGTIPTSVPEPASLALFGMGAFGLIGAAAVRRARSQRGANAA